MGYRCPKCDKTVHPVKQLRQAGGFIDTCPFCTGGVVALAEAAAEQEAPRPAPTRAPVKRADAEPVAEIEPDDVIGLVRRRLAFVQKKIAELRAFEAEEAKLLRMVEAVEQTPLRAVK